MRISVQIMDADGKILAEHDADACQPSRWNAPSGQKFIGPMPQQSSDVKNTGTYELFGITFQPHLKVDRPNGYSTPAPLPSQNPGLPANFPQIPSKYPPPFGLGGKSSWGASAPTPVKNSSSLRG